MTNKNKKENTTTTKEQNKKRAALAPLDIQKAQGQKKFTEIVRKRDNSSGKSM